jgi:hypothetical protein
MAATYNGSVLSLFINGALVDSISYTGGIFYSSSQRPLLIAARSRGVDGVIDNFYAIIVSEGSLYPTALSAERIAAHYAAGTGYDADAANYFARIVAAGSTITDTNKAAVNAFVTGCKADGIWSAIKASCLLAGPDTLAGALVPLVGPAPTNFNFVTGDYNRVTGLVGDGSTKYLDSNRNNNADPQNSQHLSSYQTFAATTSGVTHSLLGSEDAGTNGTSQLAFVSAGSSSIFGRSRNGGLLTHPTANQGNNGLFGLSRATANNYTLRGGASSVVLSQASQTPSTGSITVFARGGVQRTTARLSFYSIGESLDLALLDARLTTYMASIS